MTFVIALSVVSLLTAVIGCALIWGFDVARAREIASDETRKPPKPELDAAARRAELEATTTD